MRFRIAATVFVANNGKSFAKCGNEIGSRVLHCLNHEWTRIYTNKAETQKFFTNSCSFVSIRG